MNLEANEVKNLYLFVIPTFVASINVFGSLWCIDFSLGFTVCEAGRAGRWSLQVWVRIWVPMILLKVFCFFSIMYSSFSIYREFEVHFTTWPLSISGSLLHFNLLNSQCNIKCWTCSYMVNKCKAQVAKRVRI